MTNTVHFNTCGVSDDGKYLMAIGKKSGAGDVSSPKWTMTVFKRKCPCGSTKLFWGIFYAGNETSNKGRFPCTGRVEGGSAEGHIFCAKCDRDFSVQGHNHGTRGNLTAVTKRVKSSKAMANKLRKYGLDFDLDSNMVVGTGTGTGSKTYTKGFDKDNPFKAYLKIGYSVGTDSKPYSKNSPIYHIYLDFSEDSNSQERSFSDFSPVWLNNMFRENSADVVEHMALINNDFDRKKRYYIRTVSFVHDKVKEDLYNKDGSDNSSCKMLLKKMGFRKGDALNPKNYDTAGQTLLQSLQSILEDCEYNTEMVYGDVRYNDFLDFYLKSTDPVFTIREDSANFLGMSNLTYSPLEKTHNSSYQLFKEKQKNGTDEWKYVNSRVPQSVLVYGEHSVVGKMDDGTGKTEAYHKARYYTDEFTSDMPFTYTVEWKGIPPIKVGDSVECVFDQSEYNDVKVVESLRYRCTNDDACNFITEIGLGELSPMLKLKRQMRNQRRRTKAQRTKYEGGAIYPDENTLYEFEY